MSGHPSQDEQNDCLMCIPEYRKDHIDNDKTQDNRLNSLEKRFFWIVIASFIGSTTGSFASNIVKAAGGGGGTAVSLLTQYVSWLAKTVPGVPG